MKKTILFPFFAAALVACSQAPSSTSESAPVVGAIAEVSETAVSDAHSSKNALDYGGVYEGVIPCADCPGITVKITLDYAGNYTKQMTYQEREPDNTSTVEGVYKWNEQGSVVTLIDGEETQQYQVGEGCLFMLDKQGNRILGNLADMYRLKQTAILSR